METSAQIPIKLTSFSHGGGCGCRIAPGILSEILKNNQYFTLPKALLVGIETSDDAAVYQLNDKQALIATTDFFMPIVDDPFDFGRIAAANALSDVYAMGGSPILALAIVAMPIKTLPLEVIREIMRGGAAICEQAGIPIAGGHTIDAVEPIYGLVALGTAHPHHIKRNSGAKPGDKLILGKPLGVGILSAALKKEVLSDAAYAAMIQSTTQLNTPGKHLGAIKGVHAVTDVTGFGLLGHLLEMARGAHVNATLEMNTIPILTEAADLAALGYATGASARNWEAYGEAVTLNSTVTAAQKNLLTDPQTSGGLLVSCAEAAVPEVLACFAEEGFAQACVIGEMQAGPAHVQVFNHD